MLCTTRALVAGAVGVNLRLLCTLSDPAAAQLFAPSSSADEVAICDNLPIADAAKMVMFESGPTEVFTLDRGQ